MKRQLPTIVPFLVEAFDRCDPTRSHEAKPSERLRTQHQFRNAMRALALCTVIAAALLAITAICIH